LRHVAAEEGGGRKRKINKKEKRKIIKILVLKKYIN